MSTAISLLGGVGLFLLGMTVMTEGLKALAGSALRTVLIPPPERLESSFWKVRGGNARADRFHLPRGVIRCAI